MPRSAAARVTVLHRNVKEILSKILAVVSAEGINIEMISTSEIKVSLVIQDKYMELAVRALHKAFNLEEDKVKL